MKLNLITMAIVLVALAFLLTQAPRLEWTERRLAGAAIAGVSLALLFAARLQLGSAFSIEAKATKLVTTGMYAKIRNPIYVCGELFLVGIAVFLGRWEVLLVAAALIPIQAHRARNEEKVLHAAFGEEYERYKAGTWF